MRILIIEDEEIMAENIQMILKKSGMVCNIANDGEEGIQYATAYQYDLIILDVMLPDMDGYEVIKLLRSESVDTPILMLTGLSDIENKIKGLSSGSDDYLTKPFNNDELVARIHAVTRRTQGHSTPELTVGELSLNMTTKTVTFCGSEMDLTKTEYATLELMITRKGNVLSKETFLNFLYDGLKEPELKTVDVFIHKLRKKLQNSASTEHKDDATKYIKTVWGRGYSLVNPRELAA